MLHAIPKARRLEALAIALVLAATLGLVWVMPRPPAAGLVGRYWSNAEWLGEPATVEIGAAPTLRNFVRTLPGAPQQGSVEWTGFLIVSDRGTYEFALESDDGSFLAIDGRQIVDNGGHHAVLESTGSVHLDPGPHAIRIRYQQVGGDMAFQVYWTPPGGVRSRLPVDALAANDAVARAGGRLGIWRIASIAIPVVWACLLLYVPARIGSGFVWREVRAVSPDRGDRLRAAAVMITGISLAVWSLDWGLPVGDWSADELPTMFVRDLIDHRLAGGWFDKYPLMHYMVLAIPVSAFYPADRLLVLASDSLAAHVAQLVLMRGVSVIMGVATIGAVYVCGAEMGSPRQGAFAALALVLTPLFAYYAKVANLDIPMLCWFTWALVAFVRIQREPATRHFVLLGITAAAAVATKDQAYASLALLAPAAIWMVARQESGGSALVRAVRALVDRRILAGGVAAATAFAVLGNLVFNFDGFAKHVDWLLNFGDISIAPASLAGYWELTSRTLGLVPFALGWPLTILAAAGLVGAWRHPERRGWFWLLLVPLSFHLAFTVVTRYVNDRYLLPGLVVLALFAGAALADLVGARRRRGVAWAVVLGALGYSALHAASINVMMGDDARYATRDWVVRQLPEGARIGLVGIYVPRFGERYAEVQLDASIDAVRAASPDAIVMNNRFAQRYHAARRPQGRLLLEALADGSLGYDEAFRYRAPMPAWAVLAWKPEFQGRAESDLTNLDKANPEMVVYLRRAPARESATRDSGAGTRGTPGSAR